MDDSESDRILSCMLRLLPALLAALCLVGLISSGGSDGNIRARRATCQRCTMGVGLRLRGGVADVAFGGEEEDTDRSKKRGGFLAGNAGGDVKRAWDSGAAQGEGRRVSSSASQPSPTPVVCRHP